MTGSFEVQWAAVAEADLTGIILRIAEESPSNAKTILAKIKSKTARLSKSPQRGRIVPELRSQGIAQYRELIISPWRVIYRVEDRRVVVMSVIDSRRNVEDILLGRFLH
ncbi:type II toxin-antitoxin system RelE/ParE family toxin [bacterium]|nr:type II toxin-antitoxin system RelE/ParE family toxin [bacterium]